MDTFSVLNYQGSKKSLLEFIHNGSSCLLNNDSTILDIFSGTCSVGYSYKSTNRVFANDSEYYSYIIAKAVLSSDYSDFVEISNAIKHYYSQNIAMQKKMYSELKTEEELLIASEDIDGLLNLYKKTPTIWNKKVDYMSDHPCFELFTIYYSGSYFGITQCIEIDSIRFAIEKYKGTNAFFAMLTSLFFAMKECVFSKDGHMAQPLDPNKNKKRLLSSRQKSIYNIFFDKLKEFYSKNFVTSIKDNKAFNMSFDDLIMLPIIIDEVDFIYADPPYTDMQYSRYYHLLNVVSSYNYPKPSISRGQYTKGLYVDGRYQSMLSQKSACLKQFTKLIKFSSQNHKNLAISFAYPSNVNEQKTDRYVMNIQELINTCKNHFTAKNVDVLSLNYEHSNNRNSQHKKVLEYLILCNGR